MIKLANSQVSTLDVERIIEQVILFPETQTLVLTHGGTEGNFTVLNTGDLTLDAATYYAGLYLEGALK